MGTVMDIPKLPNKFLMDITKETVRAEHSKRWCNNDDYTISRYVCPKQDKESISTDLNLAGHLAEMEDEID